MGRMKLRELINRLEELSEDGENDNMEIVYDDSYYDLIPVTTVFVIDSYKIEIQ